MKDGGPVLISDPMVPYPPQWSADGTSILYLHGGRRVCEILGQRTDLEYVKTFHHPTSPPTVPGWRSPRLRHGDNYEIGVSNLDGSNYRRLTKTKSSEANPMWSPDGSQIVFIFNRFANDDFDDEGPAGLYIMDDDGSDVRILAPRIYGIGLQAWSPNGRTLAFLVSETPPPAALEDIRYYIHTARQDGSNLTRLVESISRPAWSPDGTTIAYMPNHLSIAAINPDGSGATGDSKYRPGLHSSRDQASARITYLAWSPDGSEILCRVDPFRPGKGRRFRLRRVHRSGGSRLQAHASWSPDGSRIAVDMQKYQ